MVLAAVDPTHFAKPAALDEAILKVGATIAHALRGTLHVVHAHPSVHGGTRATDPFNPTKAAQMNAEFNAAAKAQLNKLLKSSTIPRARRHLKGEPPADAIAAIARGVSSDVLVMGALSRSGLKGMFIGNTAEDLLDRLTCDLLIVKPLHFKHRVPKARRGARLIPETPVVP